MLFFKLVHKQKCKDSLWLVVGGVMGWKYFLTNNSWVWQLSLSPGILLSHLGCQVYYHHNTLTDLITQQTAHCAERVDNYCSSETWL